MKEFESVEEASYIPEIREEIARLNRENWRARTVSNILWGGAIALAFFVSLWATEFYLGFCRDVIGGVIGEFIGLQVCICGYAFFGYVLLNTPLGKEQ